MTACSTSDCETVLCTGLVKSCITPKNLAVAPASYYCVRCRKADTALESKPNEVSPGLYYFSMRVLKTWKYCETDSARDLMFCSTPFERLHVGVMESPIDTEDGS